MTQTLRFGISVIFLRSSVTAPKTQNVLQKCLIHVPTKNKTVKKKKIENLYLMYLISNHSIKIILDITS